jgi:hypothetical protein
MFGKDVCFTGCYFQGSRLNNILFVELSVVYTRLGLLIDGCIWSTLMVFTI